jgi:prolipoprotein diacylglyceryltransferase
VIVLPAFIALVGGWALLATLAQRDAVAPHWLAGMAIAGAVLLWYCTAMIYACIRFIQEWAHPLTVVNYTTLGLASGLSPPARWRCWRGDRVRRRHRPWALAATAGVVHPRCRCAAMRG